MKEVALSEVKDGLSRYLRQTAKEEIVITRHGKAAGVLIGFASEDDWFDYRLENDPRFLERIAAARANLRAGAGAARGCRRHEQLGQQRAHAPAWARPRAAGRDLCLLVQRQRGGGLPFASVAPDPVEPQAAVARNLRHPPAVSHIVRPSARVSLLGLALMTWLAVSRGHRGGSRW